MRAVKFQISILSAIDLFPWLIFSLAWTFREVLLALAID